MLFIVVVLSLPVYAYCIWGLYEPEEAMLFMNKWRYSEPPAFSDTQLKLFKFRNIAGIAIISIYIVSIAYSAFF